MNTIQARAKLHKIFPEQTISITQNVWYFRASATKSVYYTIFVFGCGEGCLDIIYKATGDNLKVCVQSILTQAGLDICV